jgi:tetratricopeptide (TPR) repeat protein
LTATADRLTEFEEVVGYHLEQAHRYRAELGLDGEALPRLAARAAELLTSAGDRALAHVDIHAAVTLLSRATSLMQPGDPRRVEVLVDLSEALSEGGQVDRARETLREAADEAEKLGDERLAAHVLMGEWYVRGAGTGDVEGAEPDGLRAVEVFGKYRDQRGLARSWALVGSARWWTGRAGASEEALEQARQYARAAGDPRIEADSLLTLSAVLSQGPRPVDEAASRAEAILDQYSGDRTVEAYMFHALAHLRSWQGRFDEARRMSRRYRDILRDNGQEAGWADSSECAADVEVMAGNIDEAVRLMIEGQNRYQALGITDTTILPFLAHALYLADRWEEAEDPAVRAMAGGQPLWKMLAQSVLARVRARQGRAEEAEELARQALESARKTDYLVFQGRTAVAMAEVLEILGREGEARPYREEAVRVLEQKGATVWADLARSGLH